MFRPALLRASIPRRLPRAAQARRFLGTAPPSQKSRSWKSSAARWGVAIAGVYYYNTSNVFAEEPSFGLTTKPSPDDDSSNVPTLETLAHKRQDRIARQRSTLASIAGDEPLQAGHESQPQTRLDVAPSAGITSDAEPEHGAVGIGSPEDLEEEASQEGAFNPETGEINWDCPCLGGMAHGPCGEEFKGAFSCFVYSTEEPKGMDCIEKFKGMQNCFRAHPDIYGSELDGDEDDNDLDAPVPASGEPIDPKADHPLPSHAAPVAAPESSPAPSPPSVTTESSPPSDAPVSSISPPASTEPHPPASEDHELAGVKKEEAERVRDSPRKVPETTSLVIASDAIPRQAHDAMDR